ncbi:hypothetical protein AFB00_29835 (plasmid) [Pseudonocardia sp. HH130630-07]|nr:hypothetical protein AFB00_21855 [Pseudonocardia sp. HH130630-07]ANY10610.1 hypothetical protein AFB00_29835 [Pseudonocardia sp. HH130630-07]
MVVLDGSGSMTGPDPSGGTRIAAAQRAVHALVDATPDGAPVGLAVYGTGTGNSPAERERGCQDVSVVRGPTALDRAGLTGAVDALVPSGYTPIGRSLQVAAEQLPGDGPRPVVLVSDGEDTCAPPEPCEIARELAADGVDLVVHAVGFGVEDPARAQLSCIAQVTGGTYTEALDGAALNRVLPRITATALRTYSATGTAIAGAPDVAGAPVAGPGQYLDTIGQSETRHYGVDVPAGATVYLSATVAYPRVPGVNVLDDFNSLTLRTHGRAGEDCHGFETEQQNRSSDGVPLTVATTWTGAAETGDGGCTGAGRYTFALQWDGVSAGVPARLPVELSIGVEPGVSDPGPPEVLPAAGPADPAGAPVPVVAGASFATAAPLDGSGGYTDVVQRGEFVFYRVRLDWGRALAYRVQLGEAPGRGLADLSVARTVLYGPGREEIEQDFTSYNGEPQTLPGSAPAIATAPVRYLNRDAGDAAVRTQGVPGWYYIGVAVSPTHDEDSPTAGPVPIRLDLTVGGLAEPGPVYAGPATASPFDPAAPADPAAPVASADPAAAGPSLLVPALLAGAAVVLVAGVLLVLLRRRRRG